MNNHWSLWASVHGQESPGSRVYFQRLCVTEIDCELNFRVSSPSLSTAADFSTQVLTLGITRSMFTFPWALLFLCVQRLYMWSQSQKELQASYIYIISAFQCSAIVMITKKIFLDQHPCRLTTFPSANQIADLGLRWSWTKFLPADHFPLTLVVSYILMFDLAFFIINLLSISNLASFAPFQHFVCVAYITYFFIIILSFYFSSHFMFILVWK